MGVKIPVLKWELVTQKDQIRFIEKMNNLSYSMMRPSMDITETAGYEGIRVPYYPFHMRTLYDVANYSDVLRTIIMALKKEIFRSGLVIEDKFVQKCSVCGKEYQHLNKTGICENEIEQTDGNVITKVRCGGALREPDVKQKEAFEQFKEQVNENRQTLEEVLGSVEDDLNVVDDGYVVLTKDYWYNGDGSLRYSQVVEIIRGSPMTFKMVMDMKNRPGRDQDGKELYFCAEHRDTAHNDRQICEKCGKQMLRAYYVSYMAMDKKVFYSKEEAIHISKFSPSMSYGFPPIYSVWLKVMTLLAQDKYMREYYAKQRPPRGIFFVSTTNVDSLMKSWDELQRRYEENPHGIWPLTVQYHGDKAGTPEAKFIDFMRSLDEMQYTEVRNEFRRACGAVYGVMPLFQADIRSSGGLNNEGLQITVTNRAVEMSQEVYNRKILPWLAAQLGVYDYKIYLRTPESMNEKMKLEIEGLKIANAQGMKNLGFEVTLNEEGDFEYEKPEAPSETPVQPGETPSPPPSSEQGEQRFEGEPENVRRSIAFGDLNSSKDYEIIFGKEVKEPQGIEREILDLFAKNVSYEEIITQISSKHNLDRETVRNLIERMKQRGYQLRIGKEDSINDISWMLDDVIKQNGSSYEEFVKENIYKYKFEGLSKKVSEEIKNILLEGVMKKESTDKIMEKIENITDKLTKEEIERIVRTERQALENKAREFVFHRLDPQGVKKYRWVNPLDDRTTEICKKIVERTEKGVTLEELKKIINEESKKAGFEPRDFVPHISCRSTYVRVFE